MTTIILQNPSSYETRAIRTAAMLVDNVVIWNSTLADLSNEHNTNLLTNGAMPVGSVEFVRKAMEISSITEPPNITYPEEISSYLKRGVIQTTIDKIILGYFIKPIETKTFTGFIYGEVDDMDESDLEQMMVVSKLPNDTQIWMSEPVIWKSEWRYYVMDGQITGKARYDQNDDDDAPIPDETIVQNCINDLSFKHPYALDFGVLGNGETALVEVNDAWAIGLYSNSITPREYLIFLLNRWNGLKND